MKKWMIEMAKNDAEKLHQMLVTQLKASDGDYPPLGVMCSAIKLLLFVKEVERELKENDLYEV